MLSPANDEPREGLARRPCCCRHPGDSPPGHRGLDRGPPDAPQLQRPTRSEPRGRSLSGRSCTARGDGLRPRGDRVAERIRCNRSEEHTSELKSLMRTSYAVFCLKKKNKAKIS